MTVKKGKSKSKSLGELRRYREFMQRQFRPKAQQQAKEFFDDTGELFVTDHAMIRYLQRVHGLDVYALKDEILNIVMVNNPYMGNGKYPVPNTDLVAVVKDKAVVSIVPKKDVGRI